MTTHYTNFENDIHAIMMICDIHYTTAVQPLINDLEKTQGVVKVIKSPAGLKELNKIIESEVIYIYGLLSLQYISHLKSTYFNEDGIKCFIKCVIMDTFKKNIGQ